MVRKTKMTIKELKEILSKFDENLEVQVAVKKAYSRDDVYGFSNIQFAGKALDIMDKDTWVDNDDEYGKMFIPNEQHIIICGTTRF